jgi:PAS domain-containing protein
MTISDPPRVITIPRSDGAFREYVERLQREQQLRSPAALEDRLRRLFPRVAARERTLSGESPAWYVYRDGAWQPDADGPWWERPEVPRLVVSREGWVLEADAGVRGLLGIDPDDAGSHHFTDFIVPGTLGDAESLFSLIDAGHELGGTILLQPTSGDTIAVDLHASRVGDVIEGRFRLASELDVALPVTAPVEPPRVEIRPDRDLAFRRYAEQAITRMPQPTPEGLALRLRRLYPHAQVVVEDGRWLVSRETDLNERPSRWWEDESLPRLTYDAQALILEANDAAERLLGRPLVGRHWQEFVTPGTTEQVGDMLAILAETGGAVSRFRMPGADGRLVEFDSFTVVDGDTFTTVIAPRS